jgi:hypothetical protein
MTMLKLFLCCTILIFPMSLHSQSKVQCSCPKIPADGEGNTSCSAAEIRGRCNIDFNLFGPENEKRAAELLSTSSGRNISVPYPNLSADDALVALSSTTGEKLQDAILVYLAVAAADHNARHSEKLVPSAGLKELVEAVRSTDLATAISNNFSSRQRLLWSGRPNNELRKLDRPVTTTIRGATVSPGCIEFTTNELWMMFKVNWSPARIRPDCGGSLQLPATAFWRRKGVIVDLRVAEATEYDVHHKLLVTTLYGRTK